MFEIKNLKLIVKGNQILKKCVLVMIFFVIMIIIFSAIYFKIEEHGGFLVKSRTFKNHVNSKIEHDYLDLSVLKYLNNYFNQKLLNETELFDLAEHDTNIALKYTLEWNRNYSHSKSNEWSGQNLKTCDLKPPPIQTIHMNNIYWQSIVNTEDLNLYLYNAYYDNRQTTNKLRIIGISDHYNKLTNTSLW